MQNTNPQILMTNPKIANRKSAPWSQSANRISANLQGKKTVSDPDPHCLPRNIFLPL